MRVFGGGKILIVIADLENYTNEINEGNAIPIEAVSGS